MNMEEEVNDAYEVAKRIDVLDVSVVPFFSLLLQADVGIKCRGHRDVGNS